MSARRLAPLASLGLVALFVAACGPGATTSPSLAATPSAEATEPAESPAESTAAGGATIEAEARGDHGTVLYAGENGFTVYIFTMDVVDSGESACTGDCLEAWPALTVPDGTEPTAGAGITGELGTIIRADNGETQVTYNGLPLYFYVGDQAAGDVTGVYENWEVVTP